MPHMAAGATTDLLYLDSTMAKAVMHQVDEKDRAAAEAYGLTSVIDLLRERRQASDEIVADGGVDLGLTLPFYAGGFGLQSYSHHALNIVVRTQPVARSERPLQGVVAYLQAAPTCHVACNRRFRGTSNRL